MQVESSAPRLLSRLISAAVALVALVYVVASPVRAQAPSTNTLGLAVTPAFKTSDGSPLDTVVAGESFRVVLSYRDALSGQPIKGLMPSAWFRRVRPGMTACNKAAQAFRATGRVSRDDVPLTGTSFLSVDEAGRLAIIEPDVSLASSNIAALTPLGELPRDLSPNSDGFVYASLPGRGEVVALSHPEWRPVVVHRGLLKPETVLPASDGRYWVLEQDRPGVFLSSVKGDVISHVQATKGPVAVTAAGRDSVLLQDGTGRGWLLDSSNGAARLELPEKSLAPPAVATASLVVSADPIAANGLRVLYFDSPAQPRTIILDWRPTGLAVSPNGRWLLVWSSEKVEVVDLATLTRVHGFRSADEVDDALIVGNAAFLTYRTRRVVTVIDLLVLGDGDAAVRDIRLTESPIFASTKPHYALMASLAPADAVLVARPGARSLFTVMNGGGLATSPMSAITLKSDPPHLLKVLRRSLREVTPGTYETEARLFSGGSWELVATTGVGGTTTCVPVSAQGAVTGEEPALPRIQLANHSKAIRARAEQKITIRLAEASAGPRATERLSLIIMALDGGWQHRTQASRLEDGTFQFTATFPWPGQFPVIVTGEPFTPLVLEVVP